MTLSRITPIAATLFAMIAVTSRPAEADMHHIDELACELQCNAQEFRREVRAHLRHAAHYNHLISDAHHLANTARHIHQLAHNGSSLHHIERDMARIDRDFHHLEGLMDHILCDMQRGHGHAHGDIGHVFHLMSEMEGLIHHIQEDIDAMQRRPVYVPPCRRGCGNYGYGYGGGAQFHGDGWGVTLGNGSFQFHLHP